MYYYIERKLKTVQETNIFKIDVTIVELFCITTGGRWEVAVNTKHHTLNYVKSPKYLWNTLTTEVRNKVPKIAHEQIISDWKCFITILCIDDCHCSHLMLLLKVPTLSSFVILILNYKDLKAKYHSHPSCMQNKIFDCR